ncbi:MAG: hypothetical protein KBG47_08880 [Bacteroidia bacterium]|nr:hypothetical protein [Bacteroidia bacterium]
MIRNALIAMLFTTFFTACSNVDDKLIEQDFKKKCADCKVVGIYKEECQDGSILACYLVKINFTEGNDSVKSVMCQYIKGDNGEWHLVE